MKREGARFAALGQAPAREMEEAVMTVVIYGDFNCPYSYLASQRAGRLRAAGVCAAACPEPSGHRG